jgi:hypothetical protein
MYQDIVNSNDVPHARTAAIADIGKALDDLTMVTEESFMRRLFASVKVELKLRDVAVGAAAGMETATVFGLSPLVGAGLGAAASTIKFDLQRKPRPALSDRTRAFAYVYEAGKSFGIT